MFLTISSDVMFSFRMILLSFRRGHRGKKKRLLNSPELGSCRRQKTIGYTFVADAVSLRRSFPRRLRCRVLAHDVDGCWPSFHCAGWRCCCCSRPAPAPAGGTSRPSGRCSLCREGMQLCSGSAPSPPSWANAWYNSWPRTEVIYSLHWPGHHNL